MTYDEYEKKFNEIIKEKTKELKELSQEFIISNGLDGDVININNDKNIRGKLKVDHDGKINFYPYKKDGKLGINTRWMGWRGLENNIIPFTESTKGEKNNG